MHLLTERFAPSLDVSPLHRLDVSPLGRFATWTLRPLTGHFAPTVDVSPLSAFLCLFFHMGHVARVNKVDWLMDWCTFFIFKSLHLYKNTQLHATLLNFVETSTQMMTFLMLSKIASVINCLFISCEIVMPTSLKCCTLCTMTGLLVEQSDKCWGGHSARGPRIISFISMKCLQTHRWIAMYPTNLMCMSRPFATFDRIRRTSSDNVLLLSC